MRKTWRSTSLMQCAKPLSKGLGKPGPTVVTMVYLDLIEVDSGTVLTITRALMMVCYATSQLKITWRRYHKEGMN